MSLDSWIDERALDMMRALAPTRGPELLAKEPAADFGFDPLPEKEESLPEAVEATRIAPPVEPDAATVQRLRSRLAEIRRRAEMGGVVRSVPARIAPSVPVAPPPVPESLETTPTSPNQAPEEAADDHRRSDAPADEVVILPDGPGATSPEVLVSAPSTPAVPEIPPPPVELPANSGQSEVAPLPPAEAVARPAGPGLVIPEGPLAVRLDAYRRWLEKECGLANPVVFDRHGCPLHPAEGQASFIAAAVSLGVAWREACALTDPPGTLRAVHSAWGTGTMAVIPVPTRFGDLYVAGQTGAAIEPEKAAEIGSALRRTAGV